VNAGRWFTAALLVAAPVSLAAQAKPDWAGFDKDVAKAAADWRVPALAIAVVKDDSVVFAKGYGVLQKGLRSPPTSTRFAIGSTTKAMTSASIAMLVTRASSSSRPRLKYVELQLSDPWVTRSLRSATARASERLAGRRFVLGVGLEIQPGGNHPSASLHQPTASFRSEWRYHNVLYALNGVIIAHAPDPGARLRRESLLHRVHGGAPDRPLLAARARRSERRG
jgi:hypothetical protein